MAIADPAEEKKLMTDVHRIFAPNRVEVIVREGKTSSYIQKSMLANRQVPGKNRVFVCYSGTCSLPVDNPESIRSTLDNFGLTIRRELKGSLPSPQFWEGPRG